MPSGLILAPTGYPPVPDDEVLIEVEVDCSRCGPIPKDIENQLNALKAEGLRIPISKIVAYASKHYTDASDDHWGIGEDRARIQRAWETIVPWKPHKVLRQTDHAPKLVFEERSNSRQQAIVSEALAAGVGLIAATHVYQVPYRFWGPTPGLAPTDFSAPRAGSGMIHLEVRGRFNRGGWSSAKEQVWKKFGQTPSITGQLGAIFAPRTTPDTRTEELLLIDPAGQASGLGPHEPLRAILRHYAPFFESQGFIEFAARLLELSFAGRREFQKYLRRGDQALKDLHRRRLSYRTSFSVEAQLFMGSAWISSYVPTTSWEERFEAGIVIWGLWAPLLEALVNGRLRDIASANLRSWTVSPGASSAAYIVLEDGTAAAWVSTLSAVENLPY